MENIQVHVDIILQRNHDQNLKLTQSQIRKELMSLVGYPITTATVAKYIKKSTVPYEAASRNGKMAPSSLMMMGVVINLYNEGTCPLDISKIAGISKATVLKLIDLAKEQGKL